MIAAMTPFEAYKLFLAVKMHFTQPDYDIFKYKAKVKATPSSFESRKDKLYFQKLSRKKNLQEYLVSNFIEGEVKWVGDLVSEQSETIFKKWQARNESLTYIVTTEIQSLSDDFISYFKVENGQHPKLLRMYKQNKISIETLTILNQVLNFFSEWDKKIQDPIIWPSVRDKCLKYQQFLQYDRVKMKDLIRSVMVSSCNK